MDRILPWIVVVSLIGLVTIARIRVKQTELRDRRRFVRDSATSSAVETMVGLRLEQYFAQLLRELNYHDVRFASRVDVG